MFEVCIVKSEITLSVCLFFFFQAEDGIRDLVRSRGLGDVYKRQPLAELIFRRANEYIKKNKRDGILLHLDLPFVANLSLIHI